MQTLFLIVVGLLILLAITDLIVGVSNDAVNFLVSAIGSKAAPFRIIMIVASLGVLFGATFSSGMMEIARKGIFHPELFSFSDIMIIFLAVMLTDVILLDVFNSLGLPTSTTVSIVFELLGSAVAISLMLVIKNNQDYAQVSEYINSAKALQIIGGILLSVVIAFTVGAIVQYLSRLLFTFNTEKTYTYFGAIWGGIAITAITYFILVKGLKGSSFAGNAIAVVYTGNEVLAWLSQNIGEIFGSTEEMILELKGKYIWNENTNTLSITLYEWVKVNVLKIIALSFIAWSLILAALQFLTKVNILKFIVLVGTFALAMAFAGNDLVNFIGVPLAGLSSYQEWAANGAPAEGFMMGQLAKPVSTPTFFLLIAGTIMVITLWLSKKAKSVTKTSIDLSRQDAGDERFGSNAVSRGLVRAAVKTAVFFNKITPNKLKVAADKRFIIHKTKDKEKKAFDLIRAAVNLMVAGILISIGTSLKLPLSTTYVTFMVAMGTSLADRAWGRESAVYRVSGVISVIGGWFVTAMVAFTLAFIFALAMYWGSYYAMAGILALAVFSLYRSHLSHNKKITKEKELEESNDAEIQKKCTFNIIELLSSVSDIYDRTINTFNKENRKKLKKTYKLQKILSNKSKELKNDVYKTIDSFKDDSLESAPYYVQALDYLREITHALHFVVKPTFDHLNNNHKPFLKVQFEELNSISEKLIKLINSIIDAVKKEDFEDIDYIISLKNNLTNYIDQSRKNQIKRIKNKQVGTKNSLLFLNLLQETKNISLYSLNLFKSQRDFIKTNK
jgi:phosphate/sulfate permease